MNVFQKVLAKIFEITGGKDNVEVDLVDLLKKEGFYPSLETISSQLQSDGWITEARKNIVRITHWGAMEAKRLKEGGAADTSGGKSLEKEAKALVNDAKQLVLLSEEFESKLDSKRLDAVEKGLSTVSERIKAVRAQL